MGIARKLLAALGIGGGAVAIVSVIVLLFVVSIAIAAGIGYGVVLVINEVAGHTVISPWIGAIAGALLALFTGGSS